MGTEAVNNNKKKKKQSQWQDGQERGRDYKQLSKQKGQNKKGFIRTQNTAGARMEFGASYAYVRSGLTLKLQEGVGNMQTSVPTILIDAVKLHLNDLLILKYLQ